MSIRPLSATSLLTLTTLIAISSSQAYAYSDRGGKHDIAVAGGIASPSNITSLFQNPAGLSFNQQTALSVATSFSNDSFQDPSIEGGIFAGNSSIGGGILVDHATAGNGSTFINYGLGFGVAGASVGIAATMDSNGSNSNFNAGVLFGGSQPLHFGASVNAFTHSYREFGAGLGYDASGDFSLVTDATVDNNFGNLWVMPGIVVKGSTAALSLSYGFAGKSGAATSREIADGIAAGASVRFGNNLHLQAYYKELNRYYAQLSISL